MAIPKHIHPIQDNLLKRLRLNTLIQIGDFPNKGKGIPQDMLHAALQLDPGYASRKSDLETFFNSYIPGGWIEVEDKMPEDQYFLLHVPKQYSSFWFDW
ncbi:MAG: hypothetical protein ACFFFG_04240 [Candidatus Thorarchaeota archaeon]